MVELFVSLIHLCICFLLLYNNLHNYYNFSDLQQCLSLSHSSIVRKSGGTWQDSLLRVLQNQNQGVSQPGWALTQRLRVGNVLPSLFRLLAEFSSFQS